jgi:nitrogen fixation protein NifZ
MGNEMVVEIDDDPIFSLGQKVIAVKSVRNDGTYPGFDIGMVIISEGDVGYVNSIGTFLQQFYIYGVDFIDRGRIVGMRAKELDAVMG